MSRIVVTGGAGFIGSHLCEALVARGDEVVCVDDLSSGSKENLRDLTSAGGFTFVESDVSEGLEVSGHVDAVAHLASPASPPDYLRRPLQTLAVGSRGTEAALRLAGERGARFLLASTSEVYDDALEHPQTESYWGNVNPVGPRSVYDEAKRFSEALAMAYHRARGVKVGISRIFNTYGPRLRQGDGRVLSNFATQALAGEPLTIYDDGSQTRSFCYIDDLVRVLVAMLDYRRDRPREPRKPGRAHHQRAGGARPRDHRLGLPDRAPPTPCRRPDPSVPGDLARAQDPRLAAHDRPADWPGQYQRMVPGFSPSCPSYGADSVPCSPGSRSTCRALTRERHSESSVATSFARLGTRKLCPEYGPQTHAPPSDPSPRFSNLAPPPHITTDESTLSSSRAFRSYRRGYDEELGE